MTATLSEPQAQTTITDETDGGGSSPLSIPNPPHGEARIVLYTRDHCVQCDATKREAKKRDLAGVEVRALSDEQGVAFKDEYKAMQAPVIFVFDDNSEIIEHWAGFRPDRIKAWARFQQECAA